MPCSWPTSQTPQFLFQHGGQRSPGLCIELPVPVPILLQMGKALRELGLEPLPEFRWMKVRPLKMVLGAQEDRILPVPPQKYAGTLGQHVRTVGIAPK